MGPEILVLLSLLDRAAKWAELIQQARAEDREITVEEIEDFRSRDDVADQQLVEAIAAAKAAGR